MLAKQIGIGGVVVEEVRPGWAEIPVLGEMVPSPNISRTVVAFTAPFVPTGMKIGVGTPQDVA